MAETQPPDKVEEPTPPSPPKVETHPKPITDKPEVKVKPPKPDYDPRTEIAIYNSNTNEWRVVPRQQGGGGGSIPSADERAKFYGFQVPGQGEELPKKQEEQLKESIKRVQTKEGLYNKSIVESPVKYQEVFSPERLETDRMSIATRQSIRRVNDKGYEDITLKKSVAIPISQETATAIEKIRADRAIQEGRGVKNGDTGRGFSSFSVLSTDSESSFEKRIKALKEREQRIEDWKTGLGLQRDLSRSAWSPKEVLKAGGRYAIDAAAIPSVVGGRVGLLINAVQSPQGRREALSATREVPGAVIRSFDVRRPEGVINLGLIGAGVIRPGISTRVPATTEVTAIRGSTPFRAVDYTQPVLKVDRYGNVYQSAEPVAIPGQRTLTGELAARPAYDLWTGMTQRLKISRFGEDIVAKGRPTPKTDYLVFERGGQKVTASVRAEGAVPVFEGMKIKRFRELGGQQAKLIPDDITARIRGTDEIIKIQPSDIRSTEGMTFFRVKGKFRPSEELWDFRTGSTARDIFSRQRARQAGKGDVNVFDIRRGKDTSTQNLLRPATGTRSSGGTSQVMRQLETFQPLDFADLRTATVKTRTVKETRPVSKRTGDSQTATTSTLNKPKTSQSTIPLLSTSVTLTPTQRKRERTDQGRKQRALQEQRPATTQALNIPQMEIASTDTSLLLIPSQASTVDTTLSTRQSTIPILSFSPSQTGRSEVISSLLTQTSSGRTAPPRGQRSRSKPGVPKKSEPSSRNTRPTTFADTGQAYNAYAKRAQRKTGKGKYKSRGFSKINKVPLGRIEAQGAVMGVLDRFSNRSGFVKPTKGVPKSDISLRNRFNSLKSKFRTGKRNKNLLVEKSAYAIDSFEEKNDIPYKAARQRRSSAMKLLR